MKSNKYYGVSIQLPINGLHIGLSKRAYCIICFWYSGGICRV